MSRAFGDMSESEQREHQTLTERIESGLFSQAEKQEARKRLDELEWKAGSGSIRGDIEAVKRKLDELAGEGKKQGMTGSVKKAIADLNERVTAIESTLTSTLNDVIAEVTDEAKTAIYAEARAAAAEQVGNLIGGLPESEDSDEPSTT